MSREFSKQLLEIYQLQDKFLNSTGINLRVPLNYDPVIEWYRLHKSDVEKETARNYGAKQIETVLKERLSATRNSFKYYFDENHDLIDKSFPDEKFKIVLERGIAYRKDIGSTETEREQAELEGFLKINEKLKQYETPIGTKMIVISGPGIVEESAYEHNYVDIYQKDLDVNGDLIVTMTRFVCNNDYNEHANIAIQFNLNYFDKLEGPIDAWFLGHPILVLPQDNLKTSEELFTAIFNKGETSMEENVFEELVEYCMPLIQNYINILCSDTFDPEKIAIAYNAILNKADNFNLNSFSGNPIKISIQDEAYLLGTQPVRSVSTICGLSMGFNNRFQNSVAKFGLGGEKYVKNCGSCGTTIENYIARGYKCTSCGGTYEGC